MAHRWQHHSARQLAALILCLSGMAATGSTQTVVTVDLGKPVNVVSDTAIGFAAAMYSGSNFSAGGVPYLKTAGVTTARYPGNHGFADLYHWSTQKASTAKGFETGYYGGESTFANFAQMAEKLGNALIVVNYGSNIAGTGGGEPAEAAAWVAYANAAPESTVVLGKDATGKDWQTAGFWATVRASAPLAADDGLNFLRLNHPKPFGFKLWQVCDQVYNNGYYGGKNTGSPDMHGPAPSGPKDFTNLKKDPKLAPAFYGDQFNAFAKAMKAVDATISIGAAFTFPPPPDSDEVGLDWNHAVLKAACGAMDFVSLDYQTAPLLAPDYKTLDEASLLASTPGQVGALVTAMLAEYKGTCPKGHTPRIALSSASVPSWPKVEHPIAIPLWVANTYGLLEESGFLNVDWPDAYSDAMLSTDRKKFGPVYYGLQMLHIVAHAPGDALLEAKSSTPTLAVHATRRRDGIFGLILVNTDPANAATVKIVLKNGAVVDSGKRFDYGPAQLTAGAAMAVSPITGAGSEFTISVPAYSITDLLLGVK
jgi:hypothetical protein